MKSRFNLGLESLYASAVFGREYTPEEIAVACGCSADNIRFIIRSALRKLRRRVPKDLKEHV